MSKKIAIYPGSFDPITFGHVNIIERGLKIFDEIVVAVAVNSAKQTVLTLEERLDLLTQVLGEKNSVSIDSFTDKLLIEYARSKGAHIIIRGLRTVSDYEYEFQMAQANRSMAQDIDTLFMMTESRYSHISSTLIKEIVRYGGSCEGLLDPRVEKKLKEKL